MQEISFKNRVSEDLDKVNKLIASSLYSSVPLVKDIGNYIINGGGKRLRPMLVLLSAKACGYQGDEHITMATVIEFIHTATLLHDDVIDCSNLRRGQETANHLWGDGAAVLVGDFLYSRSFQLMLGLKNLKILKIIADATNTIAEGEVLQLLHNKEQQISETVYLQMIRHKTAKLFEAAAETGAILSGVESHIQNAMANYGMHLGTAYQLIDDILDYENDIEEQNLSLAIIKSKEYAFEFARREISLAKQALSELSDSEYKQSALELTDFVLGQI